MPNEYKELSCRDVGVECDFVARGETVDDILQACVDHAVDQHGMKGFGEELYRKMRRSIRTVQEGLAPH